MYGNDWKAKKTSTSIEIVSDEDADSSQIDLNELILDRISEYIIRKFKRHDIEWLIDEILKAKGFTTYISPEGTVDRPTLDQLIGTMSNFNADYGL